MYALVFGLDASTINLGNAEQARGSEIAKQAKDLTAHTLPQQILELLPKNPFLDFTGQRATSTIAVVIFASFIGFAYLRVARKQPDHGELLKRAIDAIYSLVMAIVTFVLRLTPYGVLAIMANTLSTSDFGAIWTLGKFLIASYAALITMYIIHLIILSLLGISPIRYIKDFGSINLCIHITLKCGRLTTECTNTNKTSRRARRYCQFRCDIWIVDWTKWLCRHLPCHACNYGRTRR